MSGFRGTTNESADDGQTNAAGEKQTDTSTTSAQTDTSTTDRQTVASATSAQTDGSATDGQANASATDTQADASATRTQTDSPEEKQADAPTTDAQTTGGQSEDGGWRLFARDIAVSVTAVLLLGAFLFAISGVWPPMVAIESGSMEPNMNINDLVFVMDSDRFQPEVATGETGVVTAATGASSDYSQFGEYGDVIIFEPNGDQQRTPIIHRAMFWAEEGENWCEMADSDYLGNTDPDEEQCLAPHDGFITKGDDNPTYDQVGNQISEPVQPEWVVGTAEYRIPGLGWLRLRT